MCFNCLAKGYVERIPDVGDMVILESLCLQKKMTQNTPGIILTSAPCQSNFGINHSKKLWVSQEALKEKAIRKEKSATSVYIYIVNAKFLLLML